MVHSYPAAQLVLAFIEELQLHSKCFHWIVAYLVVTLFGRRKSETTCKGSKTSTLVMQVLVVLVVDDLHDLLHYVPRGEV